MRSYWRISGLWFPFPLSRWPRRWRQTAAPATAAPLSVEGIFGPKAIRTEYVRSSRWGKDGESYLALENAPKGGQDIVRYAIADGQRQVVAGAADLVPLGRARRWASTAMNGHPTIAGC